MSVYSTIVAACKHGVAGAAVNVISEETYMVLKRNSRDGTWILRPRDLNLSGVTGSI